MTLYVKSTQNKFQKAVPFTEPNDVVMFLSGKNISNYKIYIIQDNKEKVIPFETLKVK